MVENVYVELAPLFPGFHLNTSEEGFLRPIARGTQKLLVPFVDLHPSYTFSLLCCVRLDEVEDICNIFNPAPPHYHRMTLTSVTPLKYFGQPEEYSFSTNQGLKEAATNLATISSDILRFMDQYQGVRALHDAMNSEEGSRFDISSNPGKAMRAVVLARLCSYADFTVARSRQEGFIGDWQEEDRKRFSALVTYLERMDNAHQGGVGDQPQEAD